MPLPPSRTSRLHVELVKKQVIEHFPHTESLSGAGLTRYSAIHHDQIIEAAGNGSHTDQMALVQLIEANGNCDVSISKGVIQCLDPRLIPASSSLDHHSVVAATGAMCIISTQCRAILVQDKDRRPMVEFLAKHYLDFVKWFRFLKGMGNFTLTSAAFLFMMTNIDDGLSNIVMDSRSAINLAVSLWRSKDLEGRYFIPDEDDELRCPMLLLLKRVAEDKTGRSTLLSLLHAKPARATRMAHTIAGRIQELGTRHSEGSISGSFASRHILDLVDFMRVLLYQAIGAHPFFLEPFQSPRLFFAMFRSLDLILHGMDAAGSNWQGVIGIFCFAFEVLPDIGHGRSSPIAKIKAALDGGLLRVSILLLQYIPPTSPAFAFVLDSIAKVMAYIPYRDVALSLSSAVSTLDQGMLSEVSKKAPRFLNCWVALGMARKIWDLAGDQVGMQGVCHCVQHRYLQENLSSEARKSKLCSGCHAVAYCSPECQRADWRSRHRDECAQLRMKSGENQVTSYCSTLPVRLQTDLAHFTQFMIQHYLPIFNRIHMRENLGPQLHSLILVVNFLSVTPLVQIISVATFKERNPTLHPRIRDCLNEHLQHSDTYLVDAVFPWGLLGANILVALRRCEGNNFRAVSVAVVGLLQPPTHLQTLASLALETS